MLDEFDEFEKLFTKHGFKVPAWSGVGPGWFLILDELFTGLRAIGFTGQFGQVKEKFGMLRVYLGPGEADSDEVWKKASELVRHAERASATICELCLGGVVGKLMRKGGLPGGWMMTLCDKCAVKLGYAVPPSDND